MPQALGMPCEVFTVATDRYRGCGAAVVVIDREEVIDLAYLSDDQTDNLIASRRLPQQAKGPTNYQPGIDEAKARELLAEGHPVGVLSRWEFIYWGEARCLH